MTGANAQTLSVRVEASTIPFTPLQSYAYGKVSQDVLFFGGVSGQGMHHLGQSAGVVAFSLPVFSDRIHLVDQVEGAIYTGAVGHFSTEMRDLLRFTSPGFVQYGDKLYIYGGYGPLSNGTEWFTKATMVEIDLPSVRNALRNNLPIPEAAFSAHACPAGQVAGTAIVRLGERFALIGGSNFTGDYGLGKVGGQPFENFYSDSVQIFDTTVSMTEPIQTFYDPYWLHRRDMQALPITLGPAGSTRPGFAVPGGVFIGPFPWENPLVFGLGDAEVTGDENFIQKMNQYESAHVSFYSENNNVNRLVLMGGLSFQIFDEGEFYYDFLVPWVREITELTLSTNGEWFHDSEMIIGHFPQPTTNGHFVLRPNIPVNSSGQVLLDQMPHNEHLLGRVFGGISAVVPGPEPDTYASSTVYNVYVTVGLKGDVNKDGVVNFADFSMVLGQYGTAGPEADMNLDGVVDFTDLSLILANYGAKR